MSAKLNIELWVECTHCEHSFDLIESPQNHDCYYTMLAVPDVKIWSHAHVEFNEDILCPDCSHEFNVKGVQW